MTQKGQVSSYKIFLILIAMITLAPQYIYIVSGINIVNTLAVLTIIFYVIAIKKIYKIRLSLQIISIWLFYIIYCTQCLLTVSVFKFITYTILYILLPYLLYSLINCKERFYHAIDIMIKFGTCLGLYGIVEEIFKFNFLHQYIQADQRVFHEIRYGLLRIMGTFGHPIGYGLLQVFMISLILYRMSTKSGTKRVLKISYIICLSNVFLTVSRIPIIAVVGLHLLLLTKLSKRKAINYTVFGLVGIFAAVSCLYVFDIKIPLIDDLVQTVRLIIDGGNSTSTTVGVGSRFDLWKWVPASMGDKWFTGYGMSASFSYKVYEWATKKSIENQYLNILYYNGLIGLIPMIISFWGVLKATKRKCLTLIEESQISFNSISFFLMFLYYICQFGTQESDMTRMYVFYVVLILVYNRVLAIEGINK